MAIRVLLITFILISSSALATNYYVSPTGDDGNSGLDTLNAWESVDRGDELSILVPGDTVNILAGNYSFFDVVHLTSSGTSALPITYRKYGTGSAVLDINGTAISVIWLQGNNVVIDSLELTNSGHNGIYIDGDSSIVTNCYIHSNAWHGISMVGDDNLILKNIISNNNIDAIHNWNEGLNNKYYGNTLYNSIDDGIDLYDNVTTARVFNNIIVGNGYGVYSRSQNVFAFNDVWDNDNYNYLGGASDSSGGISANPLFTNSAAGDFRLQPASPCINAGLDLDYPYNGSAPEMGAVEYIPSGGNVYWVSPTGNDGNDGLDSTTAWASIDNGEILLLIAPGDTVNILPGNYLISNTINLTTNGAPGQLIVYRKFGMPPAVIDANNQSNIIIFAEGDYTKIQGLELTNANEKGIQLEADYCTITDCYIHQINKDGIKIEGSNNSILRNVISYANDHGIKNEDHSDYNTIYGNTIYSCNKNGIEMKADISRIFNNIIVLNDKGINANNQSVCGFNDVWGNTGGNYAGGIVDSAGGISTDPLFIDAPGGDFALNSGSPCINAGLDLGYPYLGTDPEMGAIEFDPPSNLPPILSPIGPKAVIEGQSLDFVVSARDPNGATTSLTTSALPSGAAFVDNGDDTGTFAWTPSYLQSSVYNVTFYATDDSAAVDSELVVITVSEAGNQTPVLDSIGAKAATVSSLLNFDITASDPESVPSLTTSVLPPGAGFVDNGDGSGSFNWIPTLAQLGNHFVTFYATDDSSAQVNELVEIIVTGILVSPIPVGNKYIYPTETQAPVLSFQLNNHFVVDKDIESIILRDCSRGIGNSIERLSNIDSISLYLDTDKDSILTLSDSLMASTTTIIDSTVLSFSPLTIQPDSSRIFIIETVTNLFPHDGDSLDMYLSPSTDIQMSDSTLVGGPDSLNSLGYNIINGMTTDQLSLITTGISDMVPGDSLYNVLTVDIPRNGYREDRLQIFDVWNAGTATEADLDSMILYMDDGNNSWGGAGEEIRLGLMTFTGSRWSISGLAQPLTEQQNRYYLAIDLAEYPTNGSTIALGIPLNGISVSSSNDGPLNSAVASIDTITIQTDEQMFANIIDIASRDLIPGQSSGPIWGLEFTNGYASSIVLDSIKCNLIASDPDGSDQNQLDSQIDSLFLYINRDGDFAIISLQDTLISTATLTDGTVIFDTLDLTISNGGGILGLSIVAEINSDNAKNGNLINIGILDTTDIYFDQAAVISGDIPLQNPDDFIINAFPAGNVEVLPVSSGTFFGGEVDQLVFDFILPGNGYSLDTLVSIELNNLGTLNDTEALDNVKLWIDLLSDGFTADDSVLTDLTYGSGLWSSLNIGYPISNSSERFLITVDITNSQFEGGTMQFQLPVQGVEYQSGTNGPDDMTVYNPATHLVFPSDRITVISIPMASTTILPGGADNNILTFALYNGYLDHEHILQSIRLSNISHSRSVESFSDYELGQISLYSDLDNNRVFSDDSLISTGYFTDGHLNMSGLTTSLPPDSLSYFFVVVDIPLDVIDADSLAVSIDNPSDLVFSESVNINGDMPVSCDGYHIIDGSTTGQYEIIPLLPQTLSPGDTSITLFSFKPAKNGDQSDTLESLTIQNLNDADTSDINVLELWLDNNDDEQWQNSDSLLGVFSFITGSWNLSSINLPINATKPTLFVLGEVSLSAQPNTSFMASIPIAGCQYESNNDGPLDEPIESTNAFVISSSSLRITEVPLPETRSVGQTVQASITVTNVTASPLNGVYGEVVSISDSNLVSFDSASSGPVTLDANESVGFSFYYTAISEGDINWQLRAIAPSVPDSSATIRTNNVTLQISPENVNLEKVSSIPTTVTRGQSNIFPFSFKYNHPDTGYNVASLRLDSLRIDILDGSGQPLNANDVFSRLVLATGYTNLSIIENVPSQSSVLFEFGASVIVDPDQEKHYILFGDIDSTASASSFSLSLEIPGSIVILDNNTLLPVSYDSSVVFPIRTATCRIEDPSQQMMISYQSLLRETVNFGQEDVDVIRLRIRHPGLSTSSQIQLSSLSFVFADSLDSAIQAGDLLDEIEIKKQQYVIGSYSEFNEDTSVISIQLNSPLTLNPGEIDSMEIAVSIREDTSIPQFKFIIEDSTHFEIRDLSSGSMLNATTDTILYPGTSVFPIKSTLAILKNPAPSMELCISSSLPSSIIGGTDSLAIWDIMLYHPSTNNYSSIRARNVLITATDTLGVILNPNNLFDRIGISIAGSPIEYRDYFQLQYGSTLFEFADSGLVVNPGDSLDITVVADFEADTPYSYFVLTIQSDESIFIHDEADTTHYPDIMISDNCDSVFPYNTGVTRILLPAERPSIEFVRLPAQISFPGQTDVIILEGVFRYNYPSPQGDIGIRELRGGFFKRTSDGLAAVNGNSFLKAVNLLINDQLVASDSVVTNDSLIIELDNEYVISNGSDLSINLSCDFLDSPQLGNYLISFEDSSFLDIVDLNLTDTVYSLLVGDSYPFSSAEVSLSLSGLDKSFTNYPNPFNLSRGETTIIGFVLSEDAYIDIEIFTITGRSVKTITMNSFRSSGSYQSDIWTGINDTGLKVVPGTYFCRITARYVSGREESFRRKIAIIR